MFFLVFHTFELEVVAKQQVLGHDRNVSQDLKKTELRSHYIFSDILLPPDF